MAARVRLTDAFYKKAMDAALPGLAARASRIRASAQSIAATEGIRMQVGQETGTRPRGRRYARVYSDNWQQEWGTAKTARRRVLGRAAGGSQ